MSGEKKRPEELHDLILKEIIPPGRFVPVFRHPPLPGQNMDELEQIDMVETYYEGPEELFAVQIHDDSMYPEVMDNDFLVVARDKKAKSGNIVLVVFDGEISNFHARKYVQKEGDLNCPARCELVALHEGFPMRHPNKETAQILGVGVSTTRRFDKDMPIKN